MNVRRSIIGLFAVALCGVILFAVVAFFSAVESRYECDGGFTIGNGKRSVKAFTKLHEYRWWVGFWSDPNVALRLEVPNETVEYYAHVVGNGDQLQIRENGKLRGNFSLRSKMLPLKTSRGFYDGICKRITQ